MQQGYKNFQPIQKGEVVATNQDGPILTPEGGRIFMPLYQKQGSDGFFVTKQFDSFWLKISQMVRRLRLDSLLPYLPGFKRSKADKQTLIINMKIAKWGALDFIHLLGYRKDKIIDGKLVVSKRKYDLREPGKEELKRNFAGLGDGTSFGESS